MLSFWAGGISSFPPCAREYRLLRRLAVGRRDIFISPRSQQATTTDSIFHLLSITKIGDYCAAAHLISFLCSVRYSILHKLSSIILNRLVIANIACCVRILEGVEF